jgi:hypothetical protein
MPMWPGDTDESEVKVGTQGGNDLVVVNVRGEGEGRGFAGEKK